MQLSDVFRTLFQEFVTSYEIQAAPSRFAWYADPNYVRLRNFFQDLKSAIEQHSDSFNDADIIHYLNDIVVRYGSINTPLLECWLSFTDQYNQKIPSDITLQSIYIPPSKAKTDFKGIISGLEIALDKTEGALTRQRETQHQELQQLVEQAQEAYTHAQGITTRLIPETQTAYMMPVGTKTPTLPSYEPKPALPVRSVTVLAEEETTEINNHISENFLSLFTKFFDSYKTNGAPSRIWVTDTDTSYPDLLEFLEVLQRIISGVRNNFDDADIIRFVNDHAICYGSKNRTFLNNWLEFITNYYKKISIASAEQHIQLPNNLGETIELLRTKLLKAQQDSIQERKIHEQNVQKWTQHLLKVKTLAQQILVMLEPVKIEVAPPKTIAPPPPPPAPPPPPPPAFSKRNTVPGAQPSLATPASTQQSIFQPPQAKATFSISEIKEKQGKLRKVEISEAPKEPPKTEAELMLKKIAQVLAKRRQDIAPEEPEKTVENNEWSPATP